MIMSSTENLVLACFTLYATPIAIMSLPGPAGAAENLSNRIKHRWQYEAADGQFQYDIRTKGPDSAVRNPLMRNIIYTAPAPAPEPAVASESSGSEFFSSFEEFEAWMKEPEAVVNAGIDRFFSAPEKLDKFLETLD